MYMSDPRVHTDRTVFGPETGAATLLAEIGTLGWSRFRQAEPLHLSPHLHDGFYEICLIVDGEVEWSAGENDYVLRGGDLFVTRPGELHQGLDKAMQPCVLYWLLLAPCPIEGRWLGLQADQYLPLADSLGSLPFHKWRANDSIEPAFRNLLREHVEASAARPDESIARLAAQVALQALIIGLIRSAENLVERQPTAATPEIAGSQIENIKDNVRATLGDSRAVGKVLGLSPLTFERLNRHFTTVVGLSIADFRARERVRAAKALLRQNGVSITAIAADLGFSSSQHFATTFRRLTGLTPSAYRTGASD